MYTHIFSYKQIYVYVGILRAHFAHKVKLATVVEVDPKAPFSIATTPRCSEGRYSFL